MEKGRLEALITVLLVQNQALQSAWYTMVSFVTFRFIRSLIQILDAEIFDLMHQNGDYTHFYFCYRWFLLDFKRGKRLCPRTLWRPTDHYVEWSIIELIYEDVFMVWETIWAARFTASTHFVLFVALALVKYYRDIILANAMDFTDIIKFFNGMTSELINWTVPINLLLLHADYMLVISEMAERHDAKAMLRIARDLVLQLQTLIENK